MIFVKTPRMARQLPTASYAVTILFVLLLAMFLGLMIAAFPAGFVIRLLLIPMALGAFMLAWMLRKESNGFPGPWFFSLLLACVALSIVWPRYIFFSLGGPHVNPQTLAVMGAFGAFIMCFAYSPELSRRVSSVISSGGWVGRLILIWFAWRLFTSLLGEYPVASAVEFLRDFVYVCSFFFLGCAIVSYENGKEWLLRTVVVAGVLVSGIGLIEGFTQKNAFVRFASGGDSASAVAALKNLAIEKIRGGSYRAQAVFDHPIVFAQFVAAMIPLGAYFMMRGGTFFWRMMGALILPLGVLAIMKSGSRAGLVSLVVAISVFGIVFWLRAMNSKAFSKVVAIAAVPALVGGIGVAYYVIQQLAVGRTHSESGSSEVRVKMLHDGVSALAESPLWGFGQGSAVSKAGVLNVDGLATLDNYLLTIALDSGYIGLAIFLLIIGIFTVRGLVVSVRLPGAEGVRVAMCVASVLALVATFAGLSIPNNMTLLWLLIAATLPSLAVKETATGGKV